MMNDKVAVDFTKIPQELKSSCSFCVWKTEKRGKEKPKVPYDPKTGKKARTNDPSTFTDFGAAAMVYAIGGYDGVGFRVSKGIGAIDIDHCFNDDGSLNDVATAVLDIFKSAYFERSPSGNGLRGFFKAASNFAYDKTLYKANNRDCGLEIYLPETTNRFVTVTGNVYREGDIPLDMDALKSVLDKFMKRDTLMTSDGVDTAEAHSYLTDEEVIKRLKEDVKFQALYLGAWEGYYGSHSDADMGFANKLAFWCGRDEEQMDRLFRASGLMRSKWDRMTGGKTYGQITLHKAAVSAKNTYDPNYLKGSAEEDFSVIDDDENGEDQYAKPQFAPDYTRIRIPLEQLRPTENTRYLMGEIGLGHLFADYYADIARYNGENEIWYIYDGKIWREDIGALAINRMASKLAKRLLKYATELTDEKLRTQFIKRYAKLQNRRNRKTMIDDAKSDFPITQAEFDRDPYLFNCENGTLDLRTMEYREHSPYDYLTKISKVIYDETATCPRWEQFISEIMCGDAELARYFQKALGYAMTGDTSLECMFILYGATSRNGKSTAMETFLTLMGKYGRASQPTLLDAKARAASASGPSDELASLKSVRFANVSEPERKLTFNAALIKQMTGNDTINARHLYHSSFDFKPTFKLFVNTNYLPGISDLTLFDSDRLKIIPFNRHFSEEEQDKSLKAFFAEEDNLSGILNWCLEGCRLWRQEGLKTPDAVRAAIASYRQDSDYIGQFIDAWLEKGGAYEVRTSAVHKVYRDWCEKNGYRAENAKNFNYAIERYFRIERKRPNDGGGTTTMLIGCRLLPHERGEDIADGDFEMLTIMPNEVVCPF